MKEIVKKKNNLPGFKSNVFFLLLVNGSGICGSKFDKCECHIQCGWQRVTEYVHYDRQSWRNVGVSTVGTG